MVADSLGARIGYIPSFLWILQSSAYGTFREDELGTLEEGKLADIVVLDRNFFEVPVEEIMDTKVLLTMVDGKIVFNSNELKSRNSLVQK